MERSIDQCRVHEGEQRWVHPAQCSWPVPAHPDPRAPRRADDILKRIGANVLGLVTLSSRSRTRSDTGPARREAEANLRAPTRRRVRIRHESSKHNMWVDKRATPRSAAHIIHIGSAASTTRSDVNDDRPLPPEKSMSAEDLLIELKNSRTDLARLVEAATRD